MCADENQCKWSEKLERIVQREEEEEFFVAFVLVKV